MLFSSLYLCLEYSNFSTANVKSCGLLLIHPLFLLYHSQRFYSGKNNWKKNRKSRLWRKLLDAPYAKVRTKSNVCVGCLCVCVCASNVNILRFFIIFWERFSHLLLSWRRFRIICSVVEHFHFHCHFRFRWFVAAAAVAQNGHVTVGVAGCGCLKRRMQRKE